MAQTLDSYLMVAEKDEQIINYSGKVEALTELACFLKEKGFRVDIYSKDGIVAKTGCKLG